MQVADVVGDSTDWADHVAHSLAKLLRFYTWATAPSIFGGTLHQMAHAVHEFIDEEATFHEHCGEEQIAVAAEGLSSLPDHLQQRVFAKASNIHSGADEYCCPLSYCLLDILPRSMSRSILSNLATGDTLTAILAAQYTQVLTALQHIPPSPPLYSSLVVDSIRSIDGTSSPGLPRTWARDLSGALQQQTSITSLTLRRQCADVETFLQAGGGFACMASIQTLHLQPDRYLQEVSPTLCGRMRQLFTGALELQHLSMELLLMPSSRLRKRRRRDGGVQLPPAPDEYCVLNMLSAASALTSLCITIKFKHRSEAPVMPIWTASLPHLVDLEIVSSVSTWPLRFLGCLQSSAPLTRLSITDASPATTYNPQVCTHFTVN